MIKRLFSLFLFTFVTSAFSQNVKKATPVQGTWKGELVDLYCYTGFYGKGAVHKDCAKICLDSGLPAGLAAENGDLFLLTDLPHHHNDMSKKMSDLVAQQISVTGIMVEVGGMKVIQVESFGKTK